MIYRKIVSNRQDQQHPNAKRTVLATQALCILFALTFGAAQAQGAEFNLKIGTMGLNDQQTDYLNEFKKRLEKETQNGISVNLYPGGQLGSIADQVKGLQLGTIEMFVVPPGFLAGIEPTLQVASAPGLFRNMRHAHRAFTSEPFRMHFLDAAVTKGIKGITIWDSGATDYATMKPIRSLNDFKGKKIRVLATKIESKIMDKLGAAGVPMDIVDVLPALQRGALDGIRSVASIMDARKFWTTTKNITVVNDTHIPLVAWVGMPFYKKLPKKYQQALLRVGRGLEPYMLERSLDRNKKAYASWKSHGANVISLSKKDRAEFLSRVANVADEVMGNDPKLKGIYETLKKAARDAENN